MRDTVSVCVYCGSSSGNDPQYTQHAQIFGRALAQSGMRLIYGAGDRGVMGACANAALDAGGEVMGVIPSSMVKREWGKRDVTHFIQTETMHERKKVMYANADAFVVLPGGLGTLDEFFEILTWRQLGFHDRPIFLLNTAGFWTPLIAAIRACAEAGFVHSGGDQAFVVTEDPAALPAAIRDALSARSASAQ